VDENKGIFRLKTKENRGAMGNKSKQAWKYTPKKER